MMKWIAIALALFTSISCQISAEKLESPIITDEIIRSVNEANAGRNNKFENAKLKDIKQLLGTIIISEEANNSS